MYIQHHTNALPHSQALGNCPHTSNLARQSYQTLHMLNGNRTPDQLRVDSRTMYGGSLECTYVYMHIHIRTRIHRGTYIYMYIYMCTYTNCVWRFTGKWAVKLVFCR